MKKIGFWTALSLVIGNIIGVGIFTTTGYVANRIDNPYLILWVWAVGAVYALSGAVVYSLLAKLMPHRGGDYYYLKEYLPPYFSFLFGWSGLFITYTGSIAALAIGAASYLNDLAPLLHLNASFFFVDGIKIAAIVLVLIFTIINISGIRSGGQTQFYLTFIIFVLLIGFIVLGYFAGARELQPAVLPLSTGQVSLFFSSLAAVLFTYMGWTTIVYIADEVENPRKNIPLALITGVSVIALLYMGINYIFLSILPASELAGQINVATLVADKLWGAQGAQIIAGMILIAILSSLNSTVLSGPRIYQAMAADGFLWNKLSDEHKKYNTPAVALWIQGGWSVLLLLSGTFDQLLTMVVAVILMFSILTAIVAIKILLTGQFKKKALLWITTLTYLLLCLMIFLNILTTQFIPTITGILILTPSIPIYIWQRKSMA